MQKPEHAETKKPNIIFIMSDDVGFEEIGCYGVLDGKSITPHIDSLADNGVRFNICYAQAICGPRELCCILVIMRFILVNMITN